MVELSAPLSLQTGRRSTKKTGLPRTRTVGRRFVLQPVRSRSCLLSELGEGVLRQLDNSLCPNATHNLQGLFAGQLGAASVAAPPAGIFCSQPSAVLPCLEQPCKDHNTRIIGTSSMPSQIVVSTGIRQGAEQLAYFRINTALWGSCQGKLSASHFSPELDLLVPCVYRCYDDYRTLSRSASQDLAY